MLCAVGSEDLDLVRRAFVAFERRDAIALASCFHDDGVFDAVTARVAGAGEPYVGREGMRRYVEDVARVWEELRPEPRAFHEVGDGTIVVLGRIYAWGVGRVVDAPAGWVIRIRDGRIAHARVYETARGALEAGGLPPDTV
jgi:ketosteroid isomerase-like protein